MIDHSKDQPGYLSPHFRESEFACNHCGELDEPIPEELLEILEDVRSAFGDAPVTINSGYRCEQHNQNVGGATNSQHRKGTAADIVVSDVPPSLVYEYLDSQDPGVWGLGRYDTFTHVDVRGYSARW